MKFGTQVLKAQKTSAFVVNHIKQLIAPLPNRYSRGEYVVSVTTVADQLSDEYKLFWRYQSHFTLEFVKALAESLPPDVEFRAYDHLNNKLTLYKL